MRYRVDFTHDPLSKQTWVVVREDNFIIYKNHCDIQEFAFSQQLDRIFRTRGKPAVIETAPGNVWAQKAVEDILNQWEVKVEYV